ncbi:serine/threonine protein kinase [Laspinema olomoucense]|uniref:non-specific serine/threonine protein kinase n=1 Tax=Laspinema olomoucense D3b TaxID=2953688 RepID=A0ABT2N8X4_9CYAN|nr:MULTISPECIES: serine/threonine-protein kinase [unclassified Laspinema]MCT7971657.1 serine/threonine protein kinase [Laspinema sp. D3d]MCT7979148.1 serine/threonine protein kinase [Laspinema sp. D3b]MCT7992908.1 serine/threonine protein kinase [Laspinema sp. D3c]
MNDFPDFSANGYKIIRELGHNRAGGRVTYLAVDQQRQESVAIKQFQFATSGSDWSAYRAVEREIEVLQQLNHPGIPKYLNSFETADGFCMVQEYKDAQSLAVPRSFEADEVKELAIAALNILVYLQTRTPLVIHRDIKPENILVSDLLTLYLVDFGFAKLGSEDVAMSSMVKGTMGFMPPEQLLNRQLSAASDLYGLGATLICLLTGTRSVAIAELVDDDYRIQFKHLMPKVSWRWIEWLETMVQPHPDSRFPDAATALAALEPIYVVRTPEVHLSKTHFTATASTLGEQITHTLSIRNPVPDTRLQGKWQVAPHRQDPPHSPDAHAWISFSPAHFKNNNRLDTKIIIDTRQLRANQTYKRELLLENNGIPNPIRIPVEITTAPIPISTQKLPYSSLGLLFLAAGVGGMLALHSIATPIAIALSGFLAWAGLSKLAGKQGFVVKFLLTSVATTLIAAIAGFTLGMAAGASLMGSWATAGTLAATAVTGVALILAASGITKEFGLQIATALSLLTAASGISCGIALQLGFWTPLLIAAAALTGVPVIGVMVWLPIRRSRLKAKYRRSEQHLIAP